MCMWRKIFDNIYQILLPILLILFQDSIHFNSVNSNIIKFFIIIYTYRESTDFVKSLMKYIVHSLQCNPGRSTSIC